MTITETVDLMNLLRGGDNKRIIEYIDRMVKTGHTEGFDAGLDRGYNVGYAKGHTDGLMYQIRVLA